MNAFWLPSLMTINEIAESNEMEMQSIQSKWLMIIFWELDSKQLLEVTGNSWIGLVI